MSKGNTFENDLLKLIFNATAIANLADNAASSPATNFYVALHTADPGEAGDQTTNESTYTSYARVAVARTSGGWTVTNNRAVNAGAVTFPKCTADDNQTLIYWSVGLASSGASKILYSGTLGGTSLGQFVAEASDDKITCKGHGLSVDDRVAVFALPQSSLPTGLTQGTVYFVKSVADADNITLATTSGGSTVDVTADGSGVIFKVTKLIVNNNITPSFAAGALIVDED